MKSYHIEAQDLTLTNNGTLSSIHQADRTQADSQNENFRSSLITPVTAWLVDYSVTQEICFHEYLKAPRA